MRQSDIPSLETRLNQLAEALAPRWRATAGALAVWADALRDFSREQVLDVLTDWPAMRTTMPAPADVVAEARKRRSQRLEDEAERERRGAPGLSRVAEHCPTEEGRACLAEAAAALATPPHPKAWITALARREAAGEVMPWAMREAWRSGARLSRDARPDEFLASLEARAKARAAGPSTVRFEE